MTFAVCFNCGNMKVGAYTYCEVCGIAPLTKPEQEYSLLLTDHFVPRKEIKRISETMRKGGPRPLLPKKLKKKLGKDWARFSGTVGPLYVADPPSKKPNSETYPPRHVIELFAHEARQIALNAALLAAPRPPRRGPEAFDAMLTRLGQVQIDSVNVLARAHYMPGFSRLGAHDAAMVDAAAYGPRRTLFEYWGHAAALIRLDLQPALRWRMARARAGTSKPYLARFAVERRDFVDAALREIERRGPLSARELTAAGKSRGAWWGWSDGKLALEWLFYAGLVTTHSRRGFERVYDLAERVFPEVAALPTPPEDQAQRQLLMVAARALGVATAGDLRDYWRIGPQDAKSRLAELVESGELWPAHVENWPKPAFVPPGTVAPHHPAAAALVSPFDPLLWERDRAERLFGFRYRIEIYTPAEKRTHGYYVLPFLMGDRVAARLDLKADRASGRLLVHAAHLEPGADRDATAPALAAELRELAQWLGLGDVKMARRGSLAAALRRAWAQRG